MACLGSGAQAWGQGQARGFGAKMDQKMTKSGKFDFGQKMGIFVEQHEIKRNSAFLLKP